MKRATTKLIPFSKITTSSTSISCNFTTKITSSSSSISNSPIQNPCTQTLKPCSNSNTLFYNPYKTHHFHNLPSHNYSTHKITPYYPSSEQRKSKKRSKLWEVFEAAKSGEEMIQVFNKMEAKLDEADIGLACYSIGFQLDDEGEDPQKIISFGNRALAIFDKKGENQCYLFVALSLRLLGSANCRLRKFNDALGCLNRADTILVKLDNDGEYSGNEIKIVRHAVMMELANVYAEKAMIEAIIDSLRKALEINEVLMGKDSREFGDANRDFAEACVGNHMFKDGLPYCLKALEIHLRLLGENSVEVGHDRRVLGVIYAGMEEYEKAVEENRLAQKVFRICGCSSDVIRVLIDEANMLIAIGMYEAAMDTLKGVVQDSEDLDRSHILISMGKVLVHQEKFADAKSCLEDACSELDKQETSKPLEVSQAYMEIAKEYQNMNELENAISLLKRAHSLLEKLPEKDHLEGSVLGRIGWLLLLTGKVTEATPILESAVEIVKDMYGSDHFVVGYVCNNLGVAYLELERLELAAKMFSAAKDLMDPSLGPHHHDSIQACQNLSKAYAAMKSYPLAIEFQQNAVNAWESHGRSEEDELREARRLLEQLMASAHGALTKDYLTKALPLPYFRADRRDLQAPQPSSESSPKQLSG
ncbi:protein KINESIN LIGHT CHAIN-RELATED 2-like [Silene latifolia]|uniref:protein KINESIN LIGHT CHAIN-RELATED 2-like n=1 Tax=Silene latifolia TaxID=37657 RepID=UPI003D775CEB